MWKVTLTRYKSEDAFPSGILPDLHDHMRSYNPYWLTTYERNDMLYSGWFEASIRSVDLVMHCTRKCTALITDISDMSVFEYLISYSDNI